MRVNRVSFSPTTIGGATGHTDCDPLAVLFMESTLALSSLNVFRQASQSISQKNASMYFKSSAGCAASGDPRALGMSPRVFSPACPLNGQRPEQISRCHHPPTVALLLPDGFLFRRTARALGGLQS